MILQCGLWETINVLAQLFVFNRYLYTTSVNYTETNRILNSLLMQVFLNHYINVISSNILSHASFSWFCWGFFKTLKTSCEQDTVVDSMIFMYHTITTQKYFLKIKIYTHTLTCILSLTRASVLNTQDFTFILICTRRVQELERNLLQGTVLVNTISHKI